MAQNSKKLIEILEKTGLSPHEAGVYFSALSLGRATASSLSRASGIKRTTVYHVIDSLKAKGLMAEELRGFKRAFVPTNPKKLKQIFDERKTLLENHLDDFTTLYNLRDQEGTLRYHEGLEAVKSVYDGVINDLQPKDYYLVVANIEHWQELDKKFFENFVERRTKLNINARLIFTDSQSARSAKKFERNFNQKVKILPASSQIETSTIITPEKVAIQQYNLPISAIVIQTKSVIQSQKEMFEIMWNALPE